MKLIETKGTFFVQKTPNMFDSCDGKVDIRYTHDKTGTTLSLTFRDFMILCDAAELRKIIKEENENGKKENSHKRR